jgi:hypothetical protein
MTPTSTEPEIIDDVQQSINDNLYMLSARTIIQTLKELRENVHVSNRRWVWELLQNAKDVKNDFTRVSIEIRHTPNLLSFRHNGNPFTIKNLTGLIQQVSSKSSSSSDKEVSGKFGTGFISTHLLSTVIDVSGVVARANNQYRKVALTLNRSGDTAEDLLDSIRETLDRILTLDRNEAEFPLIPDYVHHRQPTDLHTEFSYVLDEEKNRKAAQAGIDDLLQTLPGTLLNIPDLKIKEVRVCQEDDTLTYEVAQNRKEGSIAWYTVSISREKQPDASRERYFLAYETDQLRLLAEVTDFDTLTLVPPVADQPMLYRDFPLIGSEKFYFPFALNGYKFFPNEARDTILINDDSGEPKQNRELVEAAQVAALSFTDWLLEHNARNRYVLANTRIPSIGMDTDALLWYGGLQTAWRKALMVLPLVETEAGTPEALESVRIPRLHGNAKSEDNKALWTLAAGFLGNDAVPRHDLLQPWIAAVGLTEEMPSWGKTLFLDTQDLLRLVAEKKGLADMPMTLAEGGSETASLAWLNQLYAFLAAQEELGLLKQITAVPNQKGTLCKLDDLFVERAEELIPAEVLDVLESLGLNWRNDLLRRDVVLPDYKHQDRGLREASTEINQLLKERENAADTLEMAFLKREDAPKILVALLRLTSPSAEDTAFRSHLFRYAKDLLHFEEDVTMVPSLKFFSFDKASQLLTIHLHQTISAAKTLEGLAAVLHMESADDAQEWLGRYLRFVADSGYKTLVEYGNIVPNQLGKLCAYQDLYNAGTRDLPLDDTLLAVLKECDAQQDWKPRLLANRIGLELPRRFTFDELGNALATFANNAIATDDYKGHMQPLLRLLHWCRASERNKLLAVTYLGKFNERLSSHWFTLTMEGSGKGAEVMRLLHNPNQIDDLVAIAESGVDVAKLRQIATLTSSNPAVFNQVLKFAQQLENDVASFKFLQSIGAAMEAAFYDALKAAGITVTIERGEGTEASVAQIGYQGIGSYDFSVHNHDKTKVFYIELKSYSVDNPMPIRLAQSQTKRAAKGDEPFALCVVGRDRDANLVDAEYVRKVLDYVKDLQADLTPIAKHIEQLEAIETQKDADVHLDVSALHGSKVFMKHAYIKARRHSFDDLIADITAALQ